MQEINNIVILTEAEHQELEEKARKIIEERNNTKTLNMRLRFPYYAVCPEDVEQHKDIPLSDILPYYIYLTIMDDKGEYLVEPDDKLFNETREYMDEIYGSRIVVVETAEEEEDLVNRIREQSK